MTALAKKPKRRASKATSQVHLWVVQRPKGWKPKDWNDVPKGKPKLLWKELTAGGCEHAFDLMFSFNNASLANDGSIWLIAIVEPN